MSVERTKVYVCLQEVLTNMQRARPSRCGALLQPKSQHLLCSEVCPRELLSWPLQNYRRRCDSVDFSVCHIYLGYQSSSTSSLSRIRLVHQPCITCVSG